MRRADKEIKNSNLIESLLRKALVCRIALCDGNKPYIVPMNFAFKDNKLYLHSAKEGRKIDIIKNNNNICFELDVKTELLKSEKPCDWSMKYFSIVGSGKAHFLDGVEDKRKALNLMMNKYSKSLNEQPYKKGVADEGLENMFKYSKESLEKLTIIKIDITEMNGKKSFY